MTVGSKIPILGARHRFKQETNDGKTSLQLTPPKRNVYPFELD